MEIIPIQPTFRGATRYITKRMPKEVLAEKQAYIFSLYKQGKNKGEIAKEIGVAIVTIGKIWKRLGIDDIIKTSFVNAINEGKSREDIIKEFHISVPTYYKMTAMYGIPTTKKDKLMLRKDEILELRAQGKKKVEIAEILNTDVQTLSLVMNELEVNTLSKDRIQNMTKSELLKLKQQHGNVHRISQATNISYPTVKKLLEFFNLK